MSSMMASKLSIDKKGTKKIILTTRTLTLEETKRLSQETNDAYELVPQADLKTEDDFSMVQIILVDIARSGELSLLSPESLRKFPNLKLIQSTQAGVDAINFEDIPADVLVCGNVGAYGEQIAEHVLGMILYLAKNLDASNSALAKGIWQPPTSIFLKGKTILLLGTGGIGESVVKLASCFGMKTIGVNTSGRSVSGFDRVIGIDSLMEVLGVADFVVIALPLTIETFQLIDEPKLRAMKSTCIMVNVARGYTVSERALYEHLKNNPNFKCALDVWWHYPKKGDAFSQKYPFFELPNFLGTPHDSGFVPETEGIALASAIENIGRFSRKEPLKGLMNRNDYLGLKELISRAN
jgi:phosphoglycerate dehydrogenase-like enzyme